MGPFSGCARPVGGESRLGSNDEVQWLARAKKRPGLLRVGSGARTAWLLACMEEDHALLTVGVEGALGGPIGGPSGSCWRRPRSYGVHNTQPGGRCSSAPEIM